MSSVQEALKAREERKKREQEQAKNNYQARKDKINAAVENYKKRKQSGSQSAVSDIANRLNSEIEAFNKVSTPSWGEGTLNNFLESTRENRLNASKLQEEIESYKSYLDENTYNSLFSIAKQLNDGYNSYLSVAEGREQFSSEDDYNRWYEKDSKRRELESAKTAEDFEEYSQMGAGVANPSWEDAHVPFEIFGWQPFGDGEDIANMVTFAEANGANAFTASAQAVRGGGTSQYGEIVNLINTYMTDEEKSIYNYYVGKGDTEKANEYLTYVTDILRQRQAGKIVEKVDNTALEAVFSLGAGLQGGITGLGNAVKLAMGDDPIPTSTLQYAHGSMSQSNEGVWKVANDLLYTTGNMAPAILGGTIATGIGGPAAGKAVGSIITGLSSAGNSYAEMIKEGYGVDQARKYGIMVGAAEGGLSYLFSGISAVGGKFTGNVISKAIDGIDNGIARFFVDFAISSSSEALEESAQAVLEPVFKMIATGEDFEGIDWSEVGYSAMLGGLSAGLLEGVPNAAGAIHSNYKTNVANGGLSIKDGIKATFKGDLKNAYNTGKQNVTESAKAYVNEALEIDPENAHAQRMQAKLDAGKDVSGYQIDRLVEANETALVSQDKGKMKAAVEARLTKLGESGDISKLADVIVKAQSGEKLTHSERSILVNSKYGRRVSTELNPQSIESGEYTSNWAESIGTDRINVEAYNRGIAEEGEASVSQAETTSATENAPAKENATEGKISTPVATPEIGTNAIEETATSSAKVEESTVTLEDASTKYGAQAQAMIHTYVEGQDVAQYDKAYQAAYDMGKSGVSLSYVMNSESVSYLTEQQRELAYEAGQAASATAAKEQYEKIKNAATGKTGRRKGTVKGEGVTISDLKKTFNDTQNTAYKILSTAAEATGIDIVLYKSEANTDGNLEGAQGKFKWSDDKIYIDINAGLANIKSVNDLAKYAMIRTFSHEFTHFIEKYNPIWYNDFRKVVFETLTERGENVNDLIEAKQAANPGMTYDKASREVVAESMTDILPDSHFVETLANKHKNIFDKLLEKLKEFLADIKAYFNTLGHNRSREANALKEQVGEAVHYVENIVKLFDKVAVEAVENYQMTVAFEEKAEKIDSTVTKKAEKIETKDENKSNVTEHRTPEVSKEKAPEGVGEYSDVYERLRNPLSRLPRFSTGGFLFRIYKNGDTWQGLVDKVNQSEGGYPVSDARGLHYKSEIYTNRADAVEDVISVARNNKLLDPTKNEEVKPNVENVNNRSTVQQPDTDRQGDTQVLEGPQTSDVSGDAQRGDSVGDSVERGQETRRDDNRLDAARTRGGSGEGNSEVGDLRRDDELTPEAKEKLHEEVTEQIAQQSTELPKGKNFVIGDSLDLPNGEKARYKANIEAIKLVKQLEAEGRYATEEEQVILSKYVGWGGLANAFDDRKSDWSKEFKELKELLSDEEYSLARGSTLNAHYTDISVIKAMYDGLAKLGFNGGRMMEPSSGVGNFVGAMPAEMSAKVKSWTMVELDGITGLIAKYLYPNADVRIQGFEKANIPNNYMDVIISNVPFGNYPITDKAYPKKVTSAIHNYFFAKSLDKVRPGGIVMFITSSYTMNSKDETVRRYIMQRADLLGAIRLPDSAFKGNAGTEVVTDILVLKKRAANTAYEGEDFLAAPYKYVNGYNGAHINSYFDAHPEMVLGTASMEGGMYRGNNLTYKALEGKGSLADQIREAFSHIEGKMDYPAQLSPEKTNFAVERAGKKTKADGYVAKNGKIYQNKDGELVEQTVTPKVAERIKGMLEIRDAAKALMNAQQQGLKETEIKKARANLNKIYDAFVKKNGYLNSPSNKSAFNDDPDRYSLFALENWNNDEKTAKKADIFSKNTIAPNRTVTSAKDVSEGLIVSVNQTGGVDTALIAALTKKSVPDVTRELIDSRLAFKNRDGILETAETYLSGNVRAKLRDAEALVPMDSDYEKNVEALKAVMPEDVSYQDIFVNPGTPWIPSSVYSDFAAYMLGGRNTEYRQDIDVTRNADTGNFTVELKNSYLKFNASNTQKWGTPRRSFLDLFDAMLNSKSVVIKDKLDDGSFVINKDATAAANEKIENITKEFQEWLWKDEARRTELATLYNEVFNSVVTPKYNGDNLTVNGANAMKPLRPHQRNAVQRIISSGGNTLLAHKVGAGKTYEMAAAAMKLKELGLVKKPMFAVPKSLVAQWGNEFIDFFPTAKLLVAEASDFTAANRKVFMNRIANGNYDAVIVSYEQFEKLPVSDDFTRELYQEQINSIIAAIEEAKAEKGGKSLSVKDLEKKRKSLQAKIDKLTDKAKDEGNIDFEELGVDSLFIDEAHNFKNLFYTTSMTNVSGLGNKDGSKRAFDLYTKVRYLQKLNGGKGIVFATATPVMNSMSEMYIMQKYLQPDLLEQLGLNTFDAWAKQFGEVVNGVEIKPSGQGYRVKQSFSRFKNMSELQLLFRNFADVLTDIPGLKIPKMKGGAVNVVVCEPSQFQKDFMKELEKRADNIKNVDPSVDNMLKITSDGRKISYTQRMIDPTLPYEDGCKIYRCADNVVRVYNDSKDIKGTQIVFLDMATPKGKSKSDTTEDDDSGMDMESARLYDDLKSRLIQNGIPSKEIAFIHDADTDQKKKKLFADVNEGNVRVLIGSTGKMGVGMNAQKRIVAIHHLDAPWRPGDVEQRNGRAFRQGNINEEVENFTYVTEGSFDARLWDILERKQNFINQVMNGESVGRETEDTGEVTLSAAEVKALASGSPLIMEQVQLDTDIKKLESLYRAHLSSLRAARERLVSDKGRIEVLERRIELGKSDMLAIKDTYSEGKFSITIGKQKFTEKKDAGAALMAEAMAKAVDTSYVSIGSFAGFDVRVIKTPEGIKGLISGKQGYPFNTYPNNTTYMINHIVSVIEDITENVNAWRAALEETKKDMAEQEKLINEPFAKQAELDEKRKRYNEVMEILNPKEEQSLDSVAEDTVQEQSRDYLDDGDNFAEGVTKAAKAVGTNYKLDVREYSLDEITDIYKRAKLDPEYDVLFYRLYEFCENAGVTFFVVPEILNKEGKQAPGVTRGNKIELSQSSFNRTDTPNEYKAQTILHEMLHAATIYAMKAYNNAIKGGATENLPKNIYNSCKEIYRVYAAISKNPRFKGNYGTKNAYEMVAKLSDPVFVEKLKGTYPSVWHELLQAICHLFGINKTFTNYDKLTRAVDEILRHPDYALSSRYNNSLVNKNAYYLEDSQYTDLDVQYQQRTDTLTDREVLEMASNEIKVSDLNQAERDALTIFQDRLSKLKDLQDKRAEQGRLYKEQQFGVKPNRAEAEKTLNRMHTLDDQIKKATADVLTVEEKEVLKRVLNKARKVVEVQERQRGQEILQRWRDRRNNAEAIKKYRDRLRGDVDELTNWIIGPNNKDIAKHVPDVLKNSVIPFLSSINFMSKRALKGGDATVSDKEFIKRLDALKSAIKTNIDVYGMYSGYNDLPPDFMESLDNFRKSAQSLIDKSNGEFIINQMTSDELRELSKVVRTLKKYIMQINRFHNNAMYQHVYEAGDNSIDFLKELDNAGSHTGGLSNFVFWQQIRPAYAFERFGEGGKAIYDGLRQGQAKLAFNTKEIESFAKKAYTGKEVKAWEDEIKEFSLGRDIVKIPVSHIMSFYELSKDPEALEHIRGDGIRVATYTRKGKKISDVGHILTVGEFNQIIGSLTDRQREVADTLQKYMAEQGGKWGNFVSVARFGEELFTNKKYFPINSDGRHLSASVEEHPSAAALYALLNMSFTKSRKEGANNRIVLYSIFDVFANHMASMAQYNAMALPILDALKWFNYQQVFIDDEGNKQVIASFREQMSRVYGVPEETKPGSGKQGYAETFIVNIIKAFNGTAAQGTPYDTLGLKSMHRYNVAQVAYNFRVVIQQPLAITRAGMIIDYKSIIKGMKLSPSAIKKNVEEMQKYSGIAAWKSLGFYDVNISRGLTHLIKHDSTALDKIADVGMWGAEKADTWTWAAIWSAAKEEVIKKQHLTPSNEGFYEAVTKLFEDIIYKTQVVDSILTKNEFMRDKGTFARLVGSFMSEPTTNASMLIDAVDKYNLDMKRGMSKRDAWQKNGRMIGRRLYVYGVGAVLLAAIQAAADAPRDDDEYEEWSEKWIEAFSGNLVDELMPFNKLPIIADFYDLAKSLLSVFGVDTYGNPPSSVFMQWYDSLVKGTEIIYNKITDVQTNYTWYAGIYKLLQAASGISGLPMASATREIITFWNNTVASFAPSLRIVTYEATQAEIRDALYEAVLSGDKKEIERIEAEYDEQKDIDAALRKALRENDPRIKEAAEARYNGDIAGYMKIAKEIIAEGHFKQDDVVAAINAEINAMKPETPSTPSDKVVSLYSVGDYYTAIMSGASSTAYAVKEDLIETEIANGKDRDEAEDSFNSKLTSHIREQYEAGEITEYKARDMLTYAGKTDEEAASKVQYWSFKKQYPDYDLSESAVSKYYSDVESSGISVEVYYDYSKQRSKAQGVDLNGDGKTDSGSVKKEVMQIIDSLPISSYQKDVLYFLNGWSQSTLWEAPWR